MTGSATNDGESNTVEQAEAGDPILPGISAPTSPGPSPNPLWPSAINVSVPETITIRMVDASALGDYEIWVFIASILSNAVVGFLIAWLQAKDANSPAQSAWQFSFIVFTILFLLSLVRAVMKRVSLQRKSKTIPLQVSQVGAPTSGAP